MAPDLPEKLLGITIDEPDDRDPRDSGDDDDETLERFVVLGIGSFRLAFHVDDVRTITDAPGELTRVPRSPDSIEGVTDLRGEITAVIDPRVHFPNAGGEGEPTELAVFDHPADQQPAAIRVHDVYGVETVPEGDVLTAADVESSDVDGSALEHPLVTGLIEQEREQTRGRGPIEVGAAGGGRSEAEPGRDGEPSRWSDDRDDGSDRRERPTALSRLGTGESTGDSIGDVFELDLGAESTDAGGRRRDEPREVVVEVTPIVDVDRLLLASGHLE